MAASHNEIAGALEDFVRRQFQVDDDDDFFTRSVNLAEEGYVDSVGLIEAVAFLEDTFAVTIPEDALFALESFDIDGLAELVVGIDGGGARAGDTVDSVQNEFVGNPDLSAVSELILATWERPCWEFTPGVLSSYVHRPSGDPELSLGLYVGGQLAAYQSAIPYEVRYRGETHRVVQGAFWTGSTEFVGQGVGPGILGEVLRRSREAGYAGFVALMQKGSAAARVLETVGQSATPPLRQLQSFREWISTPKRVRGKGEESTCPGVTRYCDDARSRCAELFAASSADLAKVVPERDVDFVLRDREGAAGWILGEPKNARALVGVLKANVLYPRGNKVTAFLENLLLEGLEASERRAFLREVFDDPYWTGVDAISVPGMGLWDADLKAIGFVETLQPFHVYYLPFDTSLRIESLDSCYLDLA